MGLRKAWLGYLFLPWLALLILALPQPQAQSKIQNPKSKMLPAAPDTGVLTRWPLPPNRGPWQLKWDDSRNRIWFGEGNHSDPTLDRIGSIDPATGVLREWGIPTEGGYVHGTGLDRNHDVWFTEVRINKVGRLQPETNTITEWTIDSSATPHGILVDDIISNSVTVWITEREQNVISSLDPLTGRYWRRRHPFASSDARPHGMVLAPDHSVWFVESCGSRVGRLVPGSAASAHGGAPVQPDVWHFWLPPTRPLQYCGAPDLIGPLFGSFVNGDFWYSEPYNGNLIRLQPDTNTFTIWPVPGAANGGKLLTQIAADPDGNIFFPEMNRTRIGRLEPVGATTPTVVAVTPTVVEAPAPPEATAVPASVVYTPIVTQLTPVQVVLTGTRNGSIVEWNLPPALVTVTPGRYIGPGRAWYGGGGFWSSLVSYDEIIRFAPYTVTSTPTPPVPTDTPTAAASPTPSPTPTCGPAWSIVPSPNVGGLDNYLQAVAAVSANDVWAVGYTGPRGSRQTLVEHWNGSEWRVVPSPNVSGLDNYLQAVAAISTSDVWAVGNAGNTALTLRWDGSRWSIVPAAGGASAGNYLTGVAVVSANEVWASGYYEDGVMYKTLVERWDGERWTVVPSPNVEAANNAFLGMAARSGSDIWAVGNYAKGTVLQTLVEHWDGTSWSIVPSPNLGPWASFSGVSAVSGADAWAVGAYSDFSPFKTLVERWDGASWSIVPSPNLGEGSILSGVASIAQGNGAWAVGSSLQAGSVLIERWDGNRWSVVPGPNNGQDNNLTGVTTLPNGEAWAVGGYIDANLVWRTLVERYSNPCATSTPTSTPTATPCAMTFSDVHPSDYFYEPVRYLYCRGVISGYGDNTFRPYNLTTRGQLAKIVVLAEGWSTYTPPTPTFRDVPTTDPFYTFIETAYNHGIISGYGCTGFGFAFGPQSKIQNPKSKIQRGCLEYRPGNNVTRAQLCKIVVLAEQWTPYTPPGPTFRDVPATDPFYQHVETAYNHGIISGYTCGPACLEFRPGNNATRGQIAKIVYLAVTSP